MITSWKIDTLLCRIRSIYLIEQNFEEFILSVIQSKKKKGQDTMHYYGSWLYFSRRLYAYAYFPIYVWKLFISRTVQLLMCFFFPNLLAKSSVLITFKIIYWQSYNTCIQFSKTCGKIDAEFLYVFMWVNKSSYFLSNSTWTF